MRDHNGFPSRHQKACHSAETCEHRAGDQSREIGRAGRSRDRGNRHRDCSSDLEDRISPMPTEIRNRSLSPVGREKQSSGRESRIASLDRNGSQQDRQNPSRYQNGFRKQSNSRPDAKVRFESKSPVRSFSQERTFPQERTNPIEGTFRRERLSTMGGRTSWPNSQTNTGTGKHCYNCGKLVILLQFVGSQKATEVAIVQIQTFLSMQIILFFQRLFVSIATEEGILPVCADRRERVPPAEDALPSIVWTDSIRVQPERQ